MPIGKHAASRAHPDFFDNRRMGGNQQKGDAHRPAQCSRWDRSGQTSSGTLPVFATPDRQRPDQLPAPWIAMVSLQFRVVVEWVIPAVAQASPRISGRG